MAYHPSSTRTASSVLLPRHSNQISKPRPLIFQPVNVSHGSSHGQIHGQDPPLTETVSGGSIEGSQYSFPSQLSTHPSACYPTNASESNSGLTSELGSVRAVSWHTPSTPSSPNNGDEQDLFSDISSYEPHSPNDPERSLQGIGSSNHDKEIYSLVGISRSNLSYEGCHLSWSSYPEVRLDCKPGISAEIPARESRLQEPWNQEIRCYNRQSFPSDVVEEGHVFQQFAGSGWGQSDTIQDAFHPHGQREGLRNNAYQDHGNIPQHLYQSAIDRDHIHPAGGTADNCSPGSSSSVNADSPASLKSVAPRNNGGRKGPLSDDSRRNAEIMRKVSSCYRCNRMREKCILDEQSPMDGFCKRCREISNNPRSWRLPCTQFGLDRRDAFVVPNFMRNQLGGPQVETFVNAHVKELVPTSSITLHLTIGFAEPLILEDAAEVVLRNQDAVQMHAVEPVHSAPSLLVKLNSPPIIPRLADRKALERHFNKWLDSVIREPNSELPEHCFPEDHEHWQRAMLTIICQYYLRVVHKTETGGSSPYHTLRQALKLTLLNHVMCHPFVVPDEKIKQLYNQLQGPQTLDNNKLVCPRLANKIIKSILLPMLTRLAFDVLADLQRLLRTRGEEESLWDPLFCIIFLCLIVVGKFQVSFWERVEVGLLNRDYSFLERDARDGIVEMEQELSVHLIGQFHARFGTDRKEKGKGKSFNPLARERTLMPSWLAQEVGFATQTYGSHIFDERKLPHHELGAMKEKNVTRLLADFMERFK